MMTATASIPLVPRVTPAHPARRVGPRAWGGSGGWRRPRIGIRMDRRSAGDAPKPPADNSDLEPEQRDYTGTLKQYEEVPLVPKKLPAMLFPAEEVLLPGSAQVLHLYEARFLALLDEVTNETGGLFAHVTFLPPAQGEADDGGLRVNQVATLVRVEEVQREEVGAKVTIIGESRMTLRELEEKSQRGYLVGTFVPIPVMQDDGSAAYKPSKTELDEVEALADFIDDAVNDCVALVDKLLDGDGDDKLWDTSGAANEVEWGHGEVGNLKRAMAWIEGPYVTLDMLEMPCSMSERDWLRDAVEERVKHSELQLAERLSFACLQVAPASTEADYARLVSCRNVAMSAQHGLMDRLRLGKILLEEQRSALRAKVALKSAFGGAAEKDDAN